MSAHLKQLLQVTGMQVDRLEALARGASSQVWLAYTPSGRVVVRLADPNAGRAVHSALFEADAGVRLALRVLDKRTPEPISTNLDYPKLVEQAWSVDRFIAGESPQRGAIPLAICQDIGEVLLALHSIRVTGYGRLEPTKKRLKGRYTTQLDGIQSRFQDPWPFTAKPLAEHPVARLSADLVAQLEAMKAHILAAAAGEIALLHSDLHEQQFIVRDGKLAALIDFGDAMVGNPAWDIASFAYFHGWTCADALVAVYEEKPQKRAALARAAKLLSISIALHHISRSFTLNRLERRMFAFNYLRLVLQDSLEHG